MAQHRFSVDITGPARAEFDLLVKELFARAAVLGGPETERRIGCECDGAFFRSLFNIVVIDGKFRVAPTPEFDRVLLALW